MKKNKVGQVYCATNKVNGKQYFGCTIAVTPEKRFEGHTKGGHGAAPLLHAAIIEFGVENFTLETVFEGTEEQALNKERWFIKKFKSQAPNGYNIKPGGALPPMLGKTQTPEAKAKISKSLIGNKRAQGSTRSAEHRARISDANQGNKNGLGYKHTEYAKARMSVARKGRKRTATTRAKITEGLLRYYANKRKDTKLKQS